LTVAIQVLEAKLANKYATDNTAYNYTNDNIRLVMAQKWLIHGVAVALNLINTQHFKTGLLIAVIVLHNSGNRCIATFTTCSRLLFFNHFY
jgi:hypothetical protein